jgi:hypothetical protein
MNSIQRFAVSVVSVAALTLVAGCSSTTKEVDTTTYVPSAPAQVIVQAPPVEVVPPPTTTISTSSDRASYSSGSGNAGTVDSSSSHHSESTTVTPSNWLRPGENSTMRNNCNRKRTATATLATALLIGGGLLGVNGASGQGTTNSLNSGSRENDSASVEAEHHYNSPAERANDALLITEVKSALADDGVGDGYLIAVDCDHGRILLSGVVSTAQDAKHAGDVAAAAQGVTGVSDRLTWH